MDKLEPRGREMFFIGHAENTDQYLVLLKPKAISTSSFVSITSPRVWAIDCLPAVVFLSTHVSNQHFIK